MCVSRAKENDSSALFSRLSKDKMTLQAVIRVFGDCVSSSSTFHRYFLYVLDVYVSYGPYQVWFFDDNTGYTVILSFYCRSAHFFG